MVKLFVEGGGDKKALRSDCRKGFHDFLVKAGFVGRLPRIVACGSRQAAYEDYCTALSHGEIAYLLVDSEGPVEGVYQSGEMDEWKPWGHLKKRDHWVKPPHADEKYCHLMTQSMETWLLADSDAMRRFYGQGFSNNALPAVVTEELTTRRTASIIDDAVRHCTTKGKNCYNKGGHSFEILSKVDPKKVVEALPWARRFIELL